MAGVGRGREGGKTPSKRFRSPEKRGDCYINLEDHDSDKTQLSYTTGLSFFLFSTPITYETALSEARVLSLFQYRKRSDTTAQHSSLGGASLPALQNPSGPPGPTQCFLDANLAMCVLYRARLFLISKVFQDQNFLA